MTSFVDSLSGTEKTLINKLRKTILSSDSAVIESPGKIMGANDALCYKENDVMKYGLARTALGFTFHSMVMYANPDIAQFVKANLTSIKLQKGCFNIPALSALDQNAFEQMMSLSAKKDFQPVIDHYKTKAGRK